MSVGRLLLVLFLLVSPCFAYYDASSMVVSYSGGNNITVDRLSDQIKMSSFNQSIDYYPIDSLVINEVLDGLTFFNNSLFFSKTGDFSSASWSFSYIINNSRRVSLLSVNPSFPFPVNDLPLNVKPFLFFDSVIQSTPVISSQASEIVSGIDDYLSAVLAVSEWVYDNINYSLYEPYQSSVISSSSTLISRRGVCDEYSVLAISLFRSLGIPARYVTGYAYANSFGLSDFGPHAWVEVYVPGEGWLPTDPTYGEHGWIDASHISLVKDAFTNKSYLSTIYSIEYPRNLIISGGGVVISNHLSSSLNSTFGLSASGFSVLSVVNESVLLPVSVSLSSDLIASGDYFFVNVSVFNPSDYFIPLSFNIITTSGMLIVNNSNWVSLLLRPNSVTNSFVLMRPPPCDKGFICVHPLRVYFPLGGYFDSDLRVDSSFVSSSSLDELLLLINDSIAGDLVVSSVRVSPFVFYGDDFNLSFSLFNNDVIDVSNVVVSFFSSLINDSSVVVPFIGAGDSVNLSVPLSIVNRGSGTIRVYAGGSFSTASLVAAIKPDLFLSFNGSSVFSSDPSFVVSVTNPYALVIPSAVLNISTPRGSLSRQFSINRNPFADVNVVFPVELLDFGVNNVSIDLSYVDEFDSFFSVKKIVLLAREGAWYDVILDYFVRFINGLIDLIVAFF